MSAPDLSIVVPVYDEARVLEHSLGVLVRSLEGLGTSFEIVAVNDGSGDGSGAILARAAGRDRRLRIETHPLNRGKGAAVRTGVLAASGARILFMDADLSTPIEEVPRFLAALDAGYDVVIGNRRAPGSKITRHQPWIRETLGKGFTILTRTLLAPGVHDFTCGFKAFRRDAARAIFSRITKTGWAFDAELVVIARVQGLRLAQVPVSWHHEDDTKVRLLGAVAGSLVELASIAWGRASGRYG